MYKYYRLTEFDPPLKKQYTHNNVKGSTALFHYLHWTGGLGLFARN